MKFLDLKIKQNISQENFSRFCSLWYPCQIQGILAMFALYGQLAKEASDSLFNEDKLIFSNFIQKMRLFGPALADETGQTTRSPDGIFHWEMFASDVDGYIKDYSNVEKTEHVENFLTEISTSLKKSDVNDLMAFMSVTEDFARYIFPWMKKIFISAGVNNFSYIDLHIMIEDKHHAETSEGLMLSDKAKEYVEKWEKLWDDMLTDLTKVL